MFMRGFGNYFWGFFLIGVGIFLLVKYYFRLSIPTIRVVVGVFFIAFGLAWLLGGFQVGLRNDMFFNKGVIQVEKVHGDYNIVFSNGVIDLTNLALEDGKTKVEVNVVFGNGVIKINADVPTVIEIDGAFARAETPDGSSISFGEHSYRTHEVDGDKVLDIDANVVFGQLKIIEVQGETEEI